MTITATDMLFTSTEVEINAGAERRLPTISILAYSGGIMTVPGWGPVAVDLAGLQAAGQVAILADHNATVGGVVGQGAAVVRDGRLVVEGVVSGTGDAARQIIELSQGGFTFQASVGIEPIQHEVVPASERVAVNGRTLSFPRKFTMIRQGRLREVSVTALGADANTSVTIAAMRKKGKAMDTDVQAVDESAIRADERDRIQRIEASCRGPQGGWRDAQAKVDSLKAKAVAGEIEERELNAQLLGILRDSRPKLSAIYCAPDVSGAVTIEAALLKRLGMASLGEKVLGAPAMERADDLRATHMLDLCRAALMIDGREIPSGREELVKAALSTITLPTALGNVANKLLLDSYEDSPATWQAFCDVRSTADFKTHTAIRPSFTGSLEQIPPGGEFKHGQAAEAKTEFSVDTFGKLLSVDRRDVINDDLSLFDSTSRAYGRAAMRKVSDLAYQVLLANAANFFGVGNKNLLTGADTALGVESLGKAITAMLTQRDEEHNDLDLRPATLLVPPELQTTARAVLESEYIAAAANLPTGNSVRQAVQLQVEPRLSNTGKYAAASEKAWYLFASPGASPMIMAFLQGKQAPTLEHFGLEADVNRLAVTWRVFHDFGAVLCDPRAAVRSKGEA